MRIKKEENNFEPFSIVVESKAEARALWNIGNCNECKSFEEYIKQEGKDYTVSLEEIIDVQQKLYRLLRSEIEDD